MKAGALLLLLLPRIFLAVENPFRTEGKSLWKERWERWRTEATA
jgi:hypothetical protein